MINKLYLQWRGLEWISLLGDSLYYLALLSYASKLDNPSLAVVVVSMSETIPNFFQILLGVLADSTKERTKRFFQSGLIRGLIYILIGIIIMKTNSIYGIFAIGFLNSFSDLFGKYASLCIDPFIKFIVPENQLEKALSINFIVRSSIGMVANFLGVILISLIGIYQLAFVNAMTFFIVSIGINMISPELRKIESKIDSQKHNSFKEIFYHIIFSLKELLAMKKIRLLFFIAAGLNSVAVTIIPISTIVLAYDKNNQIISVPFSIALIQCLIMITGIIGNWVGANYLKNVSTKTLLSISFLGNLFYVIMLFINHLWIGILILLMSIFVTSMFNLRFSSEIIKKVSAEQMGTIYGCMDTFFLVVPSVISMIFMTFASINLKIYILIVAIFCLSYFIFIQTKDRSVYF